MKTNTLGFVGGGRITKIFLQAFQNKSIRFEQVKVYDPNSESIEKLKKAFPEIELAQSPEEVASQNLVVLAVHPPVMKETLEKIKNVVAIDTVVLSLAPKITIEKIAGILSADKIVRMIPNATSYMNDGYNPVSFSAQFDEPEKKQFFSIFSSLGDNFEVAENKLEGYAVVSAMLPTYFWFQWEEMQKIAIETGFDKEEANKILETTLRKAISIFFNSGMEVEKVIDLIPVKPIGEHEGDIKSVLNTKLLGLYNKLKN